ncbi:MULTISPECIES: glycoside hydrolase family 1 protein [Lactococcus]|uniref:Glycoside hydrolase family 1 protein n=1 Tax=Lactococcus petauri TaxID=1940789 RepID=A0AAJ2ITT3_9LACT|nr:MULTISPECIES: glycoside hydrolase family 1 protein [Lactococcus]KKF90907.1 6-phospho-beta-glucosidase [Lactococcus garvieae]MBK4109653.1 glycoside hydrolase family 1 protein [Lactococcus petauri]MDT2551679.1 glycoside hydrolase family 1 protein [Lactococcus petauri]MDT2562440.1 glycoside hydrolase family 1 protein [Lactococcus petauri]MDT2574913.1 glycoside hydrolase family 1 protein [Lactococcus petauri]
MKKFPEGFLWGAALSGPQTEGYSLKEGKSASTWDYWFKENPERFNEKQSPEITSNLYENYAEDCQRMKAIGLNSIRTSIQWTRLLPDGKTLNPQAVDFYRNYFTKMKENGVKPIINLFHFDMPMWLMDKGGWEIRESVEAFRFYAQTAFECFGDLVQDWTTFNEPMVHVECGYLQGFHYPAIVDIKKAVQVAYHTLMAHVKAVQTFRELMPQGSIGIILNVSPSYARSQSAADLKAKKAADLVNIKSFLDPAVLGKHNTDLVELLKINQLLPETLPEDEKDVAANTVDFIGLNYYQPSRVQAPENASFPAKTLDDFYQPYDWPEKKMNPYRGWEIYPQAIYDVAMMMKKDYHNLPWFVSENGMGVADEERFMDDSGMIQDDYRIEFMKEHLSYLHQAIEEGSNCFGYHTWTFIDCWSWLNGYRNRYGFYRVDLEEDYKRTVKKSGLWYKKLSEHNGYEE